MPMQFPDTNKKIFSHATSVGNKKTNIRQKNFLSIPVFPKLWDTELLYTEYAWNYWLTRVPGNLSQLTQVPVDSSPRRLSINRRQNYLAQVLFDLSPRSLSVDQRWNYSAWFLVASSPQCLSVDRHWNYLARVPGVCHSTDVETIDSHPNRMYLDRHNH